MTNERSHNRKPADRTRVRVGYSLLEVMLASAICASALVPALAILRDGLLAAETIDTRQKLVIYGIQKMEEQMALVAASWATGTTSGNYSADGYTSIRYSATRSDSGGSGGITNRLMNISVTIYNDDNGNSALDSGEPNTTFTTKVSKLATYEALGS